MRREGARGLESTGFEDSGFEEFGDLVIMELGTGAGIVGLSGIARYLFFLSLVWMTMVYSFVGHKGFHTRTMKAEM